MYKAAMFTTFHFIAGADTQITETVDSDASVSAGDGGSISNVS